MSKPYVVIYDVLNDIVVRNKVYDANTLSWIPQTQSAGGGAPSSDVNITNTSIAVTGPVTDTQLRASSINVAVTNTPTVAVSGTIPVSGTFWQATQPVSGTVTASGPLTDTQLRNSAVPVSGTFFQATQPVSGTVSVSGSVATTGPLTDTQLRNTAVPVSLASLPALVAGSALVGKIGIDQTTDGTTNKVYVGNIPHVIVDTAPTTAVTGPLTDTQLRAIAVPVSGAFWQSTQPVSIASMPSTPVTGTFWQSTQPVSIASMPSTPVTGTFWQVTQPVSGTVTANAGSGTMAISAASLPLPMAAATEAKQDTGNTSLSSIDSKLSTVAAEGTIVSSISGHTPLARVNDTPEAYISGEVRPLSITAEGRLRVSTAPAQTSIEFFRGGALFDAPVMTDSENMWMPDNNLFGF